MTVWLQMEMNTFEPTRLRRSTRRPARSCGCGGEVVESQTVGDWTMYQPISLSDAVLTYIGTATRSVV